MMLKKMKVILSVLVIGLLLLNTSCSISKKNNNVQSQGSADQLEDSSMKKSLNEFTEKLFSKPLLDYEAYSSKGTVPTELWDYVSDQTLKLSDGNPEIRINYPRPVIINNLILGSYEIIKDKQQSGSDLPEITTDFIGKSGDISNYLISVNLKAKCININDLMSIIKSTIDVKTASDILKAAATDDFSGLSDTVLNLLKEKAYAEMDKEVDSTNKLDYIKVQFEYDAGVKKENGINKIVSFQEANKVKGYKNRLSIMNNIPLKRLTYLDTAKQEDLDIYNKESAFIADFFNKMCSCIDNEKMGLMAAYWNTSDKKFIEFLDKIGSPTDSKSKGLIDMMLIGGDYKTKFAYDSFPILANMEKISGSLSNINIKIHPAYSEKRKVYIISFQAPVQKINGSIEGLTTNCYYDYTVTLVGKDDNIKISSMTMNEHYFLN